jgi:hypothetical protein
MYKTAVRGRYRGKEEEEQIEEEQVKEEQMEEKQIEEDEERMNIRIKEDFERQR